MPPEGTLSAQVATVPTSLSSIWRSLRQPDLDVEHATSHYVDPVYRFFYSRVGNREDAEYLTEEVFLRAIPQLEERRSKADLARWLFRITRTVLAEYWHPPDGRGAVVPTGDGGKSEFWEEPGRDAAWGGNDGLVERVLAALPKPDRQVVELRLLHGYSIQETAQAVGVLPECVSIIQRRALARAVQIAEDVP
jgi:RNA polymerase sigma-70 factor (ECF subfamily)